MSTTLKQVCWIQKSTSADILPRSSKNLRFGVDECCDKYFKGRIDEVIIYDYALDTEAIRKTRIQGCIRRSFRKTHDALGIAEKRRLPEVDHEKTHLPLLIPGSPKLKGFRRISMLHTREKLVIFDRLIKRKKKGEQKRGIAFV